MKQIQESNMDSLNCVRCEECRNIIEVNTDHLYDISDIEKAWERAETYSEMYSETFCIGMLKEELTGRVKKEKNSAFWKPVEMEGEPV